MTNHTHFNTPSHHQQLSSSHPNTPPLTPPSDLPLNTSAAHMCTHIFKHTDTCTHPGAHLLSKSRKKCGQFSKSLPRTLMRFPMAGDLDGRKQQNAYSTQNLATRMKIHNMHMENTAGCDCFIFLTHLHFSNYLFFLSSFFLLSKQYVQREVRHSS